MLSNIFEVVYFIEYLLISVVRGAYTRPYRRLKVVVDRKTVTDLVLLGIVGASMLLPLIYIFTSILDFADFNLPDWTGWVGAVLFLIAIWLLWRSHVELGRNWTPTLGMRDEHRLVTGGVFAYIRHPMYAAHLLWGLATPLMLHSWIAGFSFLATSLVQYLSRVRSEEQMMIEQFGDEYRSYMSRTGRLFPRIGKLLITSGR